MQERPLQVTSIGRSSAGAFRPDGYIARVPVLAHAGDLLILDQPLQRSSNLVEAAADRRLKLRRRHRSRCVQGGQHGGVIVGLRQHGRGRGPLLGLGRLLAARHLLPAANLADLVLVVRARPGLGQGVAGELPCARDDDAIRRAQLVEQVAHGESRRRCGVGQPVTQHL